MRDGMTKEETTNLTLEMANSGEILDLSGLGKTVVDKHSTGGVGDKITIVLMPIIASLGIPVAKMSGRGLGFTGGTVDKMQSIPGYKTEIEINEFIKRRSAYVSDTRVAVGSDRGGPCFARCRRALLRSADSKERCVFGDHHTAGKHALRAFRAS